MIKLTKSIIFWLVLCLLTSSATVLGQGSQVVVSVPVRGELLLEYNDKRSIVLVDTFGGNVQTLVDGGPWLHSPIFAPQGNQVAYFSDSVTQRTKHNFILELPTNNQQIVSALENRTTRPLPIRWSQANPGQILYYTYSPINEESRTFEVLDLITIQLTLVGQFKSFDVWNGLTLPFSVNNVAVYNISKVIPNPIYDPWIALGVALIDIAMIPDPRTYPGDYPVEAIINDVLLWNYETQQMISVGAVRNTQVDSSSAIAWSMDGKKLLVTDYFDLRTFHHSQYAFGDIGGNWSLTFLKEIDTDLVVDEVPLIWLGVEDLMITSIYDRVEEDKVYHVGQIVNGEWHTTEFLRFPVQDFPTDIIRISDWRLLATEEEKVELSCLFDQTLPAQLTFNSSGQVVDGSSRSLREAPGMDSPVVVEMAVGATLEVISNPWCADGYRWWQIQLEDGTVGYAAEADTEQYWLEP